MKLECIYCNNCVLYEKYNSVGSNKIAESYTCEECKKYLNTIFGEFAELNFG